MARRSKACAQLSLENSLEQRNSYSESSTQYKVITRQLAIFVGSTNIALSIVENPEFRDLLLTLDKRYQVRGRKKKAKKLILFVQV